MLIKLAKRGDTFLRNLAQAIKSDYVDPTSAISAAHRLSSAESLIKRSPNRTKLNMELRKIMGFSNVG